MKIFQIGFNKCGTRSISHFFNRHGLKAADWERGKLARAIRDDLSVGRKPLSDWKDTQVFTDMEQVNAHDIIEGYREFRALDEAYNDALFILNTRNGEAWIRSRHAHGAGAYTSAYRRYFGLDTDAEVFDHWRRDWYKHHAEVLDYFLPDRGHRLFIWDIDSPDFEGLQNKVGFNIQTNLWLQRGKTASVGGSDQT